MHPKSIPQGQAVKALRDNNYRGLLTMCTGSGKSKVAIDTIKELQLKDNDYVFYLFIPRVDLREENWKQEFYKWKGQYIYDNNDILKRYCYASMGNAVRDMQEDLNNNKKVVLILDEAHHLTVNKAGMLPDTNCISHVIALTATPDKALISYLGSYLSTSHIFDYPLDQAIQDGVVPQYGIVLWKVPLSENKCIKVEYNDKKTGKTKSFMTSGKQQYDYVDNKYMSAVKEMGAHINMTKIKIKETLIRNGFKGIDSFINRVFTFNPTDNKEWQKLKYDKTLRKLKSYTNQQVYNESKKQLDELMKHYGKKSYTITKYGRIRANTIYNSDDKLNMGKMLVNVLVDSNIKFIYFAPNITKADMISDNALHSKKSNKENKAIMDAFNKGDIKMLVNVNKVNEGTNLEGIEGAVIQQFTSKSRSMTQRLGRALRSNDSPLIHIVVLKDTHDETWLKMALKDFNEQYMYNVELNNNGQGMLDITEKGIKEKLNEIYSEHKKQLNDRL